MEDFSEPSPDELVPQASSTEDNLLEYDGLDCSPTTVIIFCAKAIYLVELFIFINLTSGF